MKTNMKKIFIGFMASGLLTLAACSNHTCPTYSKADAKHTAVRT